MSTSPRSLDADGSGAGERSTPPAAEPRWLTDDEREAWVATAALMITLPAALDARLQREAGLTFFEYVVLSVLSEPPDRTLQMSDIAARASASLSRLSHVATRLQHQGLLRRSRVPGTGRRTNVTLTDAGYARVVAAAPGHVSAVREYLVDALEPHDLARLRRIGAAVAERVSRDDAFRAPAEPETDPDPTD